jgi:hypothetical protein
MSFNVDNVLKQAYEGTALKEILVAAPSALPDLTERQSDALGGLWN